MNTERYQRHSLIDWFDQEEVRSERVLVVGAGAVGNEVLKNLVLLGVGEIHLFDLDTVEIHNLTRSVLFRESDVGRSKALCAGQRLEELEPSARVHAHDGDFWSGLGFDLLRSCTAAFCCVDNFEARVRLNRLCALADVPLINTGIDSRYVVVERFPFERGRKVPCYECGLPLSAYAAMARRYSCGWLRRVAFEERKIPTTILTSSLAGSLAVSVYLRPEAAASSARHFMDSFTGQTTVTALGPREGCPGCGDLREPRVFLRAGRAVASTLAPAGRKDGLQVSCSDRIVTHVRCRACASDEAPTRVFELAARFDEQFSKCPECGEQSREVGIRDVFGATELLAEFAGRPLPGKFVTCDLDEAQVIVELEDEDGGSHGAAPDGRPNAEGRGDHSQGTDRG